MKAILIIEKQHTSPAGTRWEPFSSIEIEIPFANRKFNTVIEAVAELAAILAQLQVTDGVYRIGHDDSALVEWNGATPHVLRPVQYQDTTHEAAVKEALEASKEKN